MKPRVHPDRIANRRLCGSAETNPFYRLVLSLFFAPACHERFPKHHNVEP
jgi:hypothetical protein